MVLTEITVLLTLVAAANGLPTSADGKRCQVQLEKFVECKRHLFDWKEQQERINATLDYFKECREKNGCFQSIEEAPHDEDWQRHRCLEDLDKSILAKVVTCVQLRVSPDFQLPPNQPAAYGRYSYETLPVIHDYMHQVCKNGNVEGAMKCYSEVMNRTSTTKAERDGMWEKMCTRRSQCLELLDSDCMEKYNDYRRGVCECANDVHELYGGARLVRQLPSCAAFVNALNGTSIQAPAPAKKDSCELYDMNQRDMNYQICKFGFENYMKKMRTKNEKMKQSTPEPKTNATAKH